MEYYKKNLEALKLYNEEAYNKYLEWKPEKNELIIQKEEARDGNQILNIIKDEKKYRLNSKYYPQKEAKEWSNGFDLKNIKQVVCMFGLGNLMFPQMIKEAANKEMKLIIYEPSIEIFDYLMNNFQVGEMMLQENTIVLVKGLNDYLMYGVLDTLVSWDNEKFLIVATHPQYDKIFEEEYKEYLNELREGRIRAKMRINTVGHFGHDIVHNILESIKHLKEAQFLVQYEKMFSENIPAIIVAAGPSLDLNIDKIKNAKGKAVVIATDTSMRHLVKHKIEPDFIITVDPRKPVEYLQYEECRYTPLLCVDTANRKILSYHRGKKIFIEMEKYTSKLCPKRFTEFASLGKGGSVATAAYSVCVMLGFKTIILVGQDLAYREGFSHAGKAMIGENKHGNWLVEVEDIYGNTIYTRHEWYNFLCWFEDAIRCYANEIRVIDATEGGARIKGTEIMTLEKAISENCVSFIDCKKIVEEVGNACTKEETGQILMYMKQAIDDNEKIVKETKEINHQLEHLLTLCKRGDYGKCYRKITRDVIERGKNILQKPVCSLEEIWIAKEVSGDISTINYMGEDIADTEINVYKKTLDFYKKLNQAAKEMAPILEAAYAEMIIKED